MLSDFFKNRTLTFTVFYSLCISYLITIIVFSLLMHIELLPLLLNGSLFILFSTFSLEFLPLLLLLSLSLVIALVILKKSNKIKFSEKDILQIFLLLLFCLIVFIPVQLFVGGVIAELTGILDEELGGRLL